MRKIMMTLTAAIVLSTLAGCVPVQRQVIKNSFGQEVILDVQP